jgi:23S rRNA pseudouridine1911/1915/1917 synthase
MTPAIRILYEDNHLLGVCKPAGLLAQGDRTGDATALEQAKEYLRAAHDKSGNVFLGLVHRLDRPVSGVMVFARTSKAASRLARSFHDREVEKTYLCILLGSMESEEGELTGFIERSHNRSRLAAAATSRSREAVLSYRVLWRRAADAPAPRPGPRRGRARGGDDGLTMVEVTPRTGRHHQIRLQFSAAGHPIAGDMKYGAPAPLSDRSIALHAARLRFPHPVRDEIIELSAPPPAVSPWNLFSP